MPRKKGTPAGGTAGVGAAGQVAANNVTGPQYNRVRAARQNGLPLALSQQIDCALFVEESTHDQLTRRFAAILRRRLEAGIPQESRS